MSLADDLRRRRESWVEVGGFRFGVRRPRPLDMVRWHEIGGYAEVALRSVFNWERVTVGDVTGGAADDAPAEFSTDLAMEWLPDRTDLLLPIWHEIQRLIAEDAARRESARGN